MHARRVIVRSPDKAMGRRIATALRAAGAHVELDGSELDAALVVLHLDGELATAAAELLPRLAGDTRVIAILPRSNLAAVVDTMASSERVAGLLVADDLDPHELTAMAARVLAGDIFGLEKIVPWGTLVHSELVGNYHEKSRCIAHVSTFAEDMGVRRKSRGVIDQCLDEMLMNALYDAPVDEHGKPVFSDVAMKTRITLRRDQKVIVQYAYDGARFAVSVRDVFGTLERATVLRYIHKCLHAEQQIDRKAGGAGLGLYLVVNAANTVYFHILPGVATEVVCAFDLERAKQQLACFGFFTEKIDAAGRLAAGSSRRLPAGTSHPVERRAPRHPSRGHRGVVTSLALAIFAVIGLITALVWQRG
jgi:hypothetical protein